MSDWEPDNFNGVRDDERVEQSQREHRINICKTCDRISIFKFCKECNCFMPLKTYLNWATCPLEKW